MLSNTFVCCFHKVNYAYCIIGRLVKNCDKKFKYILHCNLQSVFGLSKKHTVSKRSNPVCASRSRDFITVEDAVQSETMNLYSLFRPVRYQ